MLTPRDAARLLAESTNAAAREALVAALGFAPPTPLPRATRDALGIPPAFSDARIAAGDGARRLLCVHLRTDAPMREAIPPLAARVASRSPHVLWAVLVHRAGAARELALATWDDATPRPRVRALVVAPDAVRDSDAQTVAALAAAREANDLVAHQRWRELLGRRAVSAAFYRALEGQVAALARALPPGPAGDERTTLALLAVSRLLFLAFLETKGWLDGDRAFLARRFDAVMASGGHAHRRLLAPLWFGTLNTPVARRAPAARAFGRVPFLNGGLFARTALERRWPRAAFPDAAIGGVFGDLLARWRFTAREDAAGWSEAAVDPEMLGLAFESLMARDARKASGAFYTPPALVGAVTRDALAAALAHGGVGDAPIDPACIADALAGTTPPPRIAARLLARARGLTVLDPACGSGAFLVAALDALAVVRAACGDPAAPHTLRRDILARQLHGVDVNPVAVWLCELRLWLAVVIEHDEPDPRRVPPLPNLDRAVRCGDALAAADFGAGDGAPDRAVGRRIAVLRERYARATGRRKQSLARQLDRAERGAALALLERQLAAVRHARQERVCAARTRDLFGARAGTSAVERRAREALRSDARRLAEAARALRDGAALPFDFASAFAAVAGEGGFGLVIGNPPWVRVHRVPPAMRLALRRRFAVHAGAAWQAGQAASGAGPGFGAQVDLAALFTERSVALARPRGVVALLLPAKLWRSLAGGGLRAALTRDTELLRLEDWSEGPPLFDAAAYPSVLLARRRPAAATAEAPRAAALRVHLPALTAAWDGAPSEIAFDATPGSPWLLLPPPVRRAFDALREAGTPLAGSGFGRPWLGVKSGVNAAFLLDRVTDGPDGHVAAVRDGRVLTLEAAWVRPVVRGETLHRWRVRPGDERLVFPHDDATGAPLPLLPPGLARWLAPWRRRLLSRADLRAAHVPWWTLFRLEAARHDRPRVVWGDFGRTPRALVLPAGDRTVPLNTCYVVAAPSDADALALAALLNGTLAGAWLGALAEPARGGWRRFLGWTMALLPLPHDWPRARALLAPLADAAWRGDPPDAETLWRSAARAYGVSPATVQPLLEWHAR